MAHRFQRLPTSDEELEYDSPAASERDEREDEPRRRPAPPSSPPPASPPPPQPQQQQQQQQQRQPQQQPPPAGQVLMAPDPPRRRRGGEAEEGGDWRGAPPGTSRLPLANRFMAVAAALFVVVLAFGALSDEPGAVSCVQVDLHPPAAARVGDVAVLPLEGFGELGRLAPVAVVWVERQLQGYEACTRGGTAVRSAAPGDVFYRYVKEVSWLRSAVVDADFDGSPPRYVGAEPGVDKPLAAVGFFTLDAAAPLPGPGAPADAVGSIVAAEWRHEANSTRVVSRSVLSLQAQGPSADAFSAPPAARRLSCPGRILRFPGPSGADEVPPLLLEAAADCVSGCAGGPGGGALVSPLDGSGGGGSVTELLPGKGCPAVVQAHGWWRGRPVAHVGRYRPDDGGDAPRAAAPWMASSANGSAEAGGGLAWPGYAFELCDLSAGRGGTCEPVPWAGDAAGLAVAFFDSFDEGAHARVLLSDGAGVCGWWSGAAGLSEATGEWALLRCRSALGTSASESSSASGGERTFTVRHAEARRAGPGGYAVSRYELRLSSGDRDRFTLLASPPSGAHGVAAVALTKHSGEVEPLSPAGVPAIQEVRLLFSDNRQSKLIAEMNV